MEEHISGVNLEWSTDDDFVNHIERGRDGKNKGLYRGTSRMDKYVHGIHQGKYYLYAGTSGSGKTTKVDFDLISTWLSAKKAGKPIKIFYCSFEVSKLDKKAKWCSTFIKMKFDVDLSTDYILGRIEGLRLSDEHLLLVKEGYKMVREFMQDVTLVDHAMNPSGIFLGIVDGHFSKYGEVLRATLTEDDKKKNRKGKITGYKNNNLDLLTILVIDHVSLLAHELGLNKHDLISEMSKKIVMLKNVFNCTTFLIQQFSVGLLTANREMIVRNKGKNVENLITPDKEDLADCKSTFNDADYVEAFVVPNKFGLVNYMMFKCIPPSQDPYVDSGLGTFFVLQYLMKNKFGQDQKMCPLFMNPVSGVYYDLPLELGREEEWYEMARQLDKTCQEYSPKES
jgi:KaiC/GvpD/RAD55 family RecA-like ATPase